MIEKCLAVEVRVSGDDCPLAEATAATRVAVRAEPPQLRADGNVLLRFGAPRDDELAAHLDADDRIRYLHRSRAGERDTYRCLSKHPCVVHELVSAGLLVEDVTYRDGDATVTGAVVGHEVLRGVMRTAGETVGVQLTRTSPLGAESAPVGGRFGLTPPQVEAVRAARAGLDADWLVVLAHVGDAVARELARETAADAVLAGHVHDRTRERVAGTLLVRPGANGRVVWEVGLGEAVVAGDGGDGGGDRGDGETDHAVTARAHEVPAGPLDAKTTERMREQLVETGLAEVVATVDAPVPRDRAACLRGECALANLATDALRWVADADVAHVDSRGLRDGPPIGPEVTDADLVGVAPFAAGVFVATLSTADLLALVGESVHPDGVDGRDGEVWTGQVAGLALRRDPDAGETKVFRAGRRLGVADDGGSVRVDERRELRLATNGYVVYTDEFETMRPADARELHGLQYDAFVAYARGVDEFAPGPDGRIGYVD